MKCPRCGKDTLHDVDFCIWCQCSLPQNRTTAPRTGAHERRITPGRKIIPILLLCGILLGTFAIIGDTIKSTAPYASQHLFPGPSMLDGAYPDRGGYTLRRVTSTIDLTRFDPSSVSAELAASQPFRHAGESETDYYTAFLDAPDQKPCLDEIVSQIRAATKDTDDQARICISLVQHIPYDAKTASGVRYPYQVLYENKGDCDEKSLLLAYLLRELGYGVALFCYEPENHMAVGISVSPEYDCHDSGYAFIETTRPGIITDDRGTYAGIGTLTSSPTIVPIAEGRPLSDIEEEFRDARELSELRDLRQPLDAALDSYHYARWQMLVDKYALDR